MRSAFPLLVVISAVVALAATGSLFASSPWIVAVQAAAIGLSVWARRSFPSGTFRVVAAPGSPSVIRRGPYRLIRHPMYAAVLLFIWTAILSHLRPVTLAIGIVVTVIVLLRVIAEERVLRANYPDYREYARSTRALIPFLV
jgi:protein-S-isoprenylcysteine O-methyltransferase Ste14